MTSEEYKKRLERDGYVAISEAELFGVKQSYIELVDTRIILRMYADKRRQKLGWTRARLAKEMGASEARCARLEQGGSNLPIEFLLRAAFALGASMGDVGSALVAAARECAEAEKKWRSAPKPKKRAPRRSSGVARRSGVAAQPASL